MNLCASVPRWEIWDSMLDLLNWAVDQISGIWSTVNTLYSTVSRWISDSLEAARRYASDRVREVSDWVRAVVDDIHRWVNDLNRYAWDGINRLRDEAFRFVNDRIREARDFIAWVRDDILHGLWASLDDIWSSLWGVKEEIERWVNDQIRWVGEGLDILRRDVFGGLDDIRDMVNAWNIGGLRDIVNWWQSQRAEFSRFVIAPGEYIAEKFLPVFGKFLLDWIISLLKG